MVRTIICFVKILLNYLYVLEEIYLSQESHQLRIGQIINSYHIIACAFFDCLLVRRSLSLISICLFYSNHLNTFKELQISFVCLAMSQLVLAITTTLSNKKIQEVQKEMQHITHQNAISSNIQVKRGRKQEPPLQLQTLKTKRLYSKSVFCI